MVKRGLSPSEYLKQRCFFACILPSPACLCVCLALHQSTVGGAQLIPQAGQQALVGGWGLASLQGAGGEMGAGAGCRRG